MNVIQNQPGFASDNHAGVHPELLEAIGAANAGHARAYGYDPWTAEAERVFQGHFGSDARLFPVFNGTGANVAALGAITRPHEAVICSDVAHVARDECGALERIVGIKLLCAPAEHGRIRTDDVTCFDSRRGDEHFPQPRVVSITQPTEYGAVYTVEETRAIADAAHERGMYLHVDGARLANAAVALGQPLGALTTSAGVDVLTFGATKNGLLFGDAVVFLRPGLADQFIYTRMQFGQLASKLRFISAQLVVLLEDDLWMRNARHANAMAARLAAAVEPVMGIEIVHPVQTNAVFARLERAAIDRLLDAWPSAEPFYVFDDHIDVCRWMCAWDTSPKDVDAFAAAAAKAVQT